MATAYHSLFFRFKSRLCFCTVVWKVLPFWSIHFFVEHGNSCPLCSSTTLQDSHNDVSRKSAGAIAPLFYQLLTWEFQFNLLIVITDFSIAGCRSNAGIFCAFHIRFGGYHFKRTERTRFVLLRLVHVMIAISATRFNAHSSTSQDFEIIIFSTLIL